MAKALANVATCRLCIRRRFWRLFSYYEPQILHTLTMLIASGDDIDPCGIDTCVTEDVGQLCNVLFDFIEHTGEQVAQVVREHLLRVDICLDAQRFYLPPDIRAADGFARAGHENHTAFNILLCCVAEHFLS